MPRRIEPERTAERERLAERLPIDHQRHVDGELHHRAGADRPAMLEPAAKLFEDRPARARRRRARRPSGRSACPAAPDRSSRRPGIRRMRRPWRAPFGQRDLGLRPHRAHLDEQLAVHVAGEQARCAAIDRVDRGRIGENGDDDLALAREFGRAWRRRAAPASASGFALSAERFHTVTVVSDLDEPLRDGRAHFADPGDADLHRPASCARTAASFGSRRDDKGLGARRESPAVADAQIALERR